MKNRSSLCWMAALVPMTATLFAQQAYSWRGLTLDETTLEQAVSILGEPSKRKRNEKWHVIVPNWSNPNRRFEVLSYENLPGMRRTQLCFSEGKLVSIALQPKPPLNPNAVAKAYGVDFSPYFPDIAAVGRKQLFYYLNGSSERANVTLQIDNRRSGKNMTPDLPIWTGEQVTFPGEVTFIQLLSKSLEAGGGLGVLK